MDYDPNAKRITLTDAERNALSTNDRAERVRIAHEMGAALFIAMPDINPSDLHSAESQWSHPTYPAIWRGFDDARKVYQGVRIGLGYPDETVAKLVEMAKKGVNS